MHRQHPLALLSLLLGVFSLSHLGTLWVDELFGVALGAAALFRPCPRQPQGRWMAILGICLGVVSLACAAVIYFVLPSMRR